MNFFQLIPTLHQFYCFKIFFSGVPTLQVDDIFYSPHLFQLYFIFVIFFWWGGGHPLKMEDPL